VENFSKTFFVGGTVRDMLLAKKITDFDIATIATPQDVIKILKSNNMQHDASNARYGVISISDKHATVEVATFRKDIQTTTRYPSVKFITSPKQDSKRRDFTINSLYFSPIHKEITDFNTGLHDVRKRTIRFIGNPAKRITEDPLRIVRALRFQLQLGFTIEQKTYTAIQQATPLLKTISQSRIGKEVNKITQKTLQQKLRTIINKMT
jgi:tRNA nucleotidyltransferase/poly(A) polymerase